MMFNYEETKSGRDVLHISTSEGVKLEILFADEKPKEIYINGYDFYVDEPFLDGLFVVINSRLVSLAMLIDAAEALYPEIIRDVRLEQRDNERMARELSNPRTLN